MRKSVGSVYEVTFRRSLTKGVVSATQDWIRTLRKTFLVKDNDEEKVVKCKQIQTCIMESIVKRDGKK
jgi:hypothetical protein